MFWVNNFELFIPFLILYFLFLKLCWIRTYLICSFSALNRLLPPLLFLFQCVYKYFVLLLSAYLGQGALTLCIDLHPSSLLQISNFSPCSGWHYQIRSLGEYHGRQSHKPIDCRQTRNVIRKWLEICESCLPFCRDRGPSTISPSRCFNMVLMPGCVAFGRSDLWAARLPSRTTCLPSSLTKDAGNFTLCVWSTWSVLPFGSHSDSSSDDIAASCTFLSRLRSAPASGFDSEFTAVFSAKTPIDSEIGQKWVF